MADRLIEDPHAVAALAAHVSDAINIPAAHIEKDFWVTEVLRGAAAAAQGVEVVFKGGTRSARPLGGRADLRSRRRETATRCGGRRWPGR
jgi:hypothetical protein